MKLRQEVLAYSRSCERLLSLDPKLTDEERAFPNIT
jgi:hypothetical protein